MNLPNRFQHFCDAQRGKLTGQYRFAPARRHKGMGSKIVDFVWLGFPQQGRQRILVEQVSSV
jgi:hypothetical protein